MSGPVVPAAPPPAGAALSGQRILITRPQEQAGAFARSLEALGARAVVFPTVAILPLTDSAALDRAISGLPGQDWLVFTSANGVRHFLARCEALGCTDSLSRLSIAAIGPQTARLLERRGLVVSLVPGEYRAEGILAALGPERVRGRRFLLARVAGARDVLPETLRRWGAEVEVVEAYRNEPVRVGAARLRELLDRMDWITFTSPSTVHAFVDLLAGANAELPDGARARVTRRERVTRRDLGGHPRGVPATAAMPEGDSALTISRASHPHGVPANVALPGAVRIACIGPVTADAARARGLEVTAVAREYTIAGLIQALMKAAAAPVPEN